MKTLFVLFFTVIFIMFNISLSWLFKFLINLLNISWQLDLLQYILAMTISFALSYLIWRLSKPEIIKIINIENLNNAGLNFDKYNYKVHSNEEEPVANVIKKQAKDFFKLAGASYHNRQEIIKEFAKTNTQTIYDGLSDEEIAYTSEDVQEFFVYEFDKIKLIPDKFHPLDDYAIEVHLEGYGMIGFVPEEINKKIYNLLNDSNNYNTEIKITGGNYKFFDYEKDRVDVKHCKYGAEIYVNFHIEL